MQADHYYFVYCDFCYQSSVLIIPGYVGFRPQDVVIDCPHCQTTHWLSHDDHIGEFPKSTAALRHFLATTCPVCQALVSICLSGVSPNPMPVVVQCWRGHNVRLTRDHTFLTLQQSDLRWSRLHNAQRLALRLQEPPSSHLDAV